MRRIIRKTAAAILAAAMLISVISAGSPAMAVEENEPLAKVDVVTEYEYGNMANGGNGGYFISGFKNATATGNAYYLDVDVDAKLTLVDKEGNVSEIQNKNDDGSNKFNRIWVSGSNYWLQLYKEEKITAVDMEGNYLGGNLFYYDIDGVIAFNEGNGLTITEKTNDAGKEFYDCELILENGKIIHLANAKYISRYSSYLTKAGNLFYVDSFIERAEDSSYTKISYLCDNQGNEIDINEEISAVYSLGDKVIINCGSADIVYVCDLNGKIEKALKSAEFVGITDNYLCIRINDEVKLYDAELNEMMSLNEPDNTYINLGNLSESGYITIRRENSIEDIVGLDGVYWYGLNDMNSVKVINVEKGYFMGSIKAGEDSGQHILSKDKTINVNADKKIKETFGEKALDYSVVTSSYYNLNGDVYVQVWNVYRDTVDKVYVFTEEDNFANPVEVNQLPVKVGDSYTKKTEDGICNIYNEDSKLIYSSSEDTLKAVYSTGYKDYNLLLAVNKDNSFSVIDWNGTVQYQSIDDTFKKNTVDDSGNMLIESKISGEDDKYRLLKAYTLLEKNDSTDNEQNNNQQEPCIYLLPADNPIITAEEFEKLLKENKNRDVIIDNGSGITFTFEKGTMERVDGKTEYDFGAIIITEYGKIDVTVPNWVEQDNFAALIHYRYSGKLPAKCAIRFNIGEEWAGKTLYYSYLKDGEVSEIKEIKVNSRGYVTVTQTHCSDYILTAENPMEKNKIPPTWDNISMSTYIIMVISAIGMLMLAAYRRNNKA